MSPEFLAISIVILLFSVILHEVMHGVVALKFGDHTAENAGRLTLNPIPHIDPIGTILVPGMLILLSTYFNSGFFIAWAKPVPVNPLNFSNIRKGELFVSAAGILSNFGLAIIAALLFHLTRNLITSELWLNILEFTVKINLSLAIFNLLPFPPLDGSNILLSQLPYGLAKQFIKLQPYGFMIILILLTTGVLQTILGFLVSIFSGILLGF